MKRLLYILTVFATASCIYPFNPDIESEIEHSLVIDGDIIAGGTSVFALGYVFPLGASTSDMRSEVPSANIYVITEDGQKFFAPKISKTKYSADTKMLPVNQRCKLHVSSGGHTYETDWMEVQQAPEITSLDYQRAGGDVQILLSLDGGDDIRYFRWDYTENWEVTADFVPDIMFNPGLPAPDNQDPSKIYRDPTEDENYYYCWMSRTPAECCLATTEGQSANRIVKNNFVTWPATNRRFQQVYALSITARGISRDCYGYWNNMMAISNNTGSLFSPTPSEVRGNIYNVDDPSEMVYGYVEATRTSFRRFFIEESTARLYVQDYEPTTWLYLPEPDEEGTYRFDEIYQSGDAPVKTTSQGVKASTTNVYWAPKRCTDCRALGGGKNKPDWWPNNHK